MLLSRNVVRLTVLTLCGAGNGQGFEMEITGGTNNAKGTIIFTCNKVH